MATICSRAIVSTVALTGRQGLRGWLKRPAHKSEWLGTYEVLRVAMSDCGDPLQAGARTDPGSPEPAAWRDWRRGIASSRGRRPRVALIGARKRLERAA